MGYLLKSLVCGFIVFVVTGSVFDAVAWGLLHPVAIYVLKWIPLVLFAHVHSMK